MLRYDAPAQFIKRMVCEDVELRGDDPRGADGTRMSSPTCIASMWSGRTR
jgi:hypothetical protein